MFLAEPIELDTKNLGDAALSQAEPVHTGLSAGNSDHAEK